MPRVIIPDGRRLKSLNFDQGTTTKVDHGDAASVQNLNVATYLFWVKISTLVAGDRICQKGLGANFYLMDVTGAGSDLLEFSINRGTLSQLSSALFTNFANWPGTGAWAFMAVVCDTGGADGDQKLYIGSLTGSATEPSSYDNQRVGSGTVGDNSGSNLVMGNRTNDNVELAGDIAWGGLWNRVLTLGEIRAQQFRPHKTPGNVLFTRYGMNGAGLQIDESGFGNHGTVTGATLAQGPPLAGRRIQRLWALLPDCPAGTDKRRGSYPPFAPMILAPCPDGTID